ncbi:50S ribosomal protein L17 [Raphidocelis subcapitata]|uniref:50S ribosomal protein L17 n=1 Tax=Raphidocelis subcapitata TaxID=307507 RepID=A0A2V0P318_9CHLO|nr:50S ribosomal protein L17 [Raphidocelis subcapitata]|eukprot:GBF93979.1 50S ribosomal protein L17 [Raphidocelis subcapitata]
MVQRIKLGRYKAHRVSMLRTMVTQLIEHERIQTTLARAKELRRLADRVVTYAKKGDRPARIEAGAVVRTDRELHKLFTTLAERYAGRAGGYTRVLQCGVRRHDAAPLAFIEFVDREGELRPARPGFLQQQQQQQQQQLAGPPQGHQQEQEQGQQQSFSHLPTAARAFLEQQQREAGGGGQQQEPPPR